MSPALRRTLAVCCGTALLAVAAPAAARPQISSGLTTGAAFTDLRAGNGPRLAYHLGGRLDVLLGRDGPTAMAVGPYVDVMTAAFDTIEGGGGIAWLVPTGAPAFVFSAGAFARSSRFGVNPGAEATIFWGPRSFNYHSSYAISAGLFVQGRYGLGGAGQQSDAVIGVQLDLEYFTLPWIFAYQALTH